jgi:hypothetical protein
MVFPVKVPYSVSADMSKFDGEFYNLYPDDYYLKQKENEIARFGSDVSNSIPDAYSYLDTVTEFLGIKKVDTITDIALQLEEDIAILDQGRLVSISFCFPSGFIPAEKLGMNFFDMHMPVGDGDRLRASSEKVSTLISREGASFRRHVWTITSLPGLSQHPSLTRPNPSTIDDLYFRTETQTTVGLSNGICVFFVKVNMTPFQICWNDEFKRNQITDSINSMSEAVLYYKNLHHIKSLLNSGGVE